MEGVEYELISSIRKLTDLERKRIAWITNHNELDSIQVQDFTNSLLSSYDVFKVNLEERNELKGYDLYSSDAKLLCEDLPRLEPGLMQCFTNET